TPVFEELGETWMRLAEYGKAVEAFGAAVNLNPSAARFAQLSSAYDKAGDRTQAAIALFAAVATDPGKSVITQELARLYEQIDPGGCALEQLPAGGRSLNLNCPLVHGHACTAFQNLVALNRFLQRPRTAAEVAATAVNSLRCAPEKFQSR